MVMCAVTVRTLRVLALLNTVNYSTVVDQSDYSISTILYNNNYYNYYYYDSASAGYFRLYIGAGREAP